MEDEYKKRVVEGVEVWEKDFTTHHDKNGNVRLRDVALAVALVVGALFLIGYCLHTAGCTVQVPCY